MVYNYISSQAIIGKVLRDFRVQRTDWINDAIEWIGEALSAIGTSAQLEDKTKIVKTHSHKARLPDDLYVITDVGYGNDNTESNQKPTREDFDYRMSYGDSHGHPSLIREDEDADKGVNTSEETFLLSDGYIKTSFESDWILISYKGFVVDDDGYPKVPDEFNFKQAAYWYIITKMVEGGEKHPAGLNYQQVEARWLKYCTQARNKAKMPDIPKYDQFLKSWVNIIPNYDRDLEKLEEQTEPIHDNTEITLDEIKGL